MATLSSKARPLGVATSAQGALADTAMQPVGIDDNATSTALVIDASGNVQVNGGGSFNVRDDGSFIKEAGGLQIGNTNGTGTTRPIRFFTESAERMQIDAIGNVLVGTTLADPITSNVSGVSIGGSDQIYRATVDGGPAFAVNRKGVNGAITSFFKEAVAVGTISVTGSATTYNTSSDYRLKDNITPIQGAGDIVKMMRPATYTFKADGSWADGFLAHELQELHPAAVTGSKDAMKDEEYEVTPAVYEDVIIPAVEAVAEVLAVYDDEGVLVSEGVPAVEAEPERTEQQLVSEAVMGTRSVPDYQGVDYSKLTPILTAALQEALAKIDALTARIDVLEGAA
jgi:hypothetical protein